MYGYDQTASAGQGYPHAGQQYGHQQPGHQQYTTQHSAPHHYGQAQHGNGQPLYPEPSSPPSLRETVRAFTTGTLTSEDFQSIFSTSKVYCPRGETPGFLALHDTQQPVIPMFTTLKELRRYAGKESRYFVITGAEVLDLLPSGYGFVLDMEGDHRVVFDAKAVEEMVDFAMRRMYG
ncbi:SseB family protein [Streptomyces ovatisporus]|uniref:SseB family protein n=1 Tax=Streptomyces ovatisporus TaxID=1128682 RepID=A0ABV9A745_9ACTN